MENNSKSQLGLLAPIRFANSKNNLEDNFNHIEFGKNLDDSLEKLYSRVKNYDFKKLYIDSQAKQNSDNLELSIKKSKSDYRGEEISLKIAQTFENDKFNSRDLYLSINFGFTNPTKFLGIQLISPKPIYTGIVRNPNNRNDDTNRAISTNPTITVGQLRTNYKTVPIFGSCLEMLANLDNYYIDEDLEPSTEKFFFI